MRAGVRAVAHRDHAVDDDGVDSHRILVRLLERRGVGDGFRVEDHDIGEVAFDEPSPIGNLHLRRRQTGHLPNRFRQRERLLLANVAAKNARERAVRARMRLAATQFSIRLDGRRIGPHAHPGKAHRLLDIVLGHHVIQRADTALVLAQHREQRVPVVLVARSRDLGQSLADN